MACVRHEAERPTKAAMTLEGADTTTVTAPTWPSRMSGSETYDVATHVVRCPGSVR